MSNVIQIEVLAEARKATASLKGVESGVTRLGNVAKSAGSAFKGFLAAGIITAGVSAIKNGFDQVVTAGSNLQQSTGAIDAVFGKQADSMKKYGDTAAQSVGLSKNAFQELASTMGASFKNQGIDDYAARTKDVIGLGADLAAQFGGSTSEAVEAVGSLMRGEADPIEKYGVSIKESAISAELAAKGQNKLKGAALEQAKAQARLSLLFKQTGDAQGAFGRESDTLAGKEARNAAAFDNTAAKIGTALLPVMTELQGFISSTLLPAFEQFSTWLSANLPGAIDTLKTAFSNVMAAIQPVITFLQENPETVKAFAITLGVLAAAVGIVAAAQWVWNAAMAANPIGIIILAIAALVAGIVYAWNNFETFRTVVLTVWGAIQVAAQAVANFFTGVIFPAIAAAIAVGVQAFLFIRQTVINVVATVQAHIKAVATFIVNTWRAIQTANAIIWNAIKSVISTVVNAVRSVVTSVFNAVRNVITTVFNAVRNVTLTVWNAIRSAVTSALNAVRSTVTNVANAVRSALVNAWNTIKSTISNAVNGAKSVVSSGFNAIKSTVSRVISSVVSTIRGIKGKITSALSGAASWLVGVGRNVVQGLVNGIQNGLGWVTSAARNLAQSAINAAKRALGIHSPSREFADLGRFLSQGLAQGIDKDGKQAVRSVERLSSQLATEMANTTLSPTYGKPAFASGSYTGRGSVVIVENITVQVPLGATSAQVGQEIAGHLKEYSKLGGKF